MIQQNVKQKKSPLRPTWLYLMGMHETIELIYKDYYSKDRSIEPLIIQYKK